MPETHWIPGPWKAIGRAVYAGHVEVVHRVKVEDVEEAKATAALIASAPDLAEVVMQLLMVDEHRESEGDPPARDEWEELVVEARAALAKARGEGENDG